MTDNEIIKALECCSAALMYDEEQSLYKLALDLINRQKAEIERLNKILHTDICFIGSRGNGKVEYSNRIIKIRADAIKAEAIKEFAMRFEDELGYHYMSNHLVVGEVLDNLVKEMVGEGDG